MMPPMQSDRGGHNHARNAPANAAHAGGALSGDVLNVPNIITFGRLCLVPVTVWLVLRGQTGVAFACFALAGVSDGVDGWLARRRGGTALGAMLDPVADKLLLVSMFVTLAAIGVLPDWLAILVVFRDLVIVGGIVLMWQLSMPVRIRPMLISKLNTALQLLLVGVVLMLEGFGLRAPGLRGVLVTLVAASTLLSGGLYVWKASRGAAGR